MWKKNTSKHCSLRGELSLCSHKGYVIGISLPNNCKHIAQISPWNQWTHKYTIGSSITAELENCKTNFPQKNCFHMI